MTYILMLLALLNGLISVGIIVMLHAGQEEVSHINIGIASLFFVNAWFFGVAAYLV